MFRFTAIISLGLVSMVSYGGQITIGGTNGLTQSYITANCNIANCLNAPTPLGAVQTSPVAAGYTNYTSGVFQGLGSPTPYTGYNATTAHTGTIKDTSTNAVAVAGAGGVTFSMINDGATSGASNNAWVLGGSQNGNPVIDIPIGVFDVTDVWTMLNSENGLANPNRDIWVTFDFSSASATATSGLTSVTLKFNNSANNSTPAGTIQNAVSCQSGTCSGANGPTVASGNPAVTTQVTGATLSTSGGSSIAGQVTVDTGLVYTSAYSSAGNTGNLILDDQGFIFSGALLNTAANAYLVDMRVYESSNSGVSSAVLSAVTVDTGGLTPTPEPSTILLSLIGLGAAGFIRRAKQVS